MNKITQNFSRVKSFDKTVRVLSKLFLLVLMTSQMSWGQQSIGTGQFDGGFEGATLNSGALSQTTPSATKWAYDSGNISTSSFISNASVARSGTKYLNFINTATSTGKYIMSPILVPALIGGDGTTANGPSYTIQFFVKTANLANVKGAVYVSSRGAGITATAAADANGWTKISYVPSKGTAVAATSGTWAGIGVNIGAAYTALIDDLVMYPGALDEIAPNATASVDVTGAATSTTVTWPAASGGVDEGGYVVVRFPLGAATTTNPNQNGIYAIGNTVNYDTATHVADATNDGTVVYVGTGLTFDDTNATAGCFYKVYTVDKAFNYSAGVSGTLSLSGPVSAAHSTVSINPVFSLGGTSTITCTALDSGNSPVSGHTFTYDVTITNADGTTSESYTVDGTARTSSVAGVSVVSATNGSGVATFDVILPATIDGNDGISIQVRLNDGTAVGSPFTYSQLATQAITFNPFGTVTYGDSALTASATGGGSGNPVVFTSSDDNIATCTGTNGTTITIIGAGNCTIYANQAGNGSYNAAPQVMQTLTVDKKHLTITADDKNVGYGTAAASVTSSATYTATGFVNSETSSVISGAPSFSTSYTNSTVVGSAGVTISPAVGTLTATNYDFTPFVNGAITVTLGSQTITLATTATKGFGFADYSPATSSTSGINPITYSSSNTAVATIVANQIHYIGQGSTDITASQAASANYAAATDVMQTLTVGKKRVLYATSSKTMTGIGASATSDDVVKRMLVNDGNFDVTVVTIDATGTGLPSSFLDYDLLVVQESIGGGDAVLTPTGKLALKNLSIPVIYNKVYALKTARAITSTAPSVPAESADLAVSVDLGNQSNPLFSGITIVNNSIPMYKTKSDDLGSNTVDTKGINIVNSLELTTTGTLKASVTTVTDVDKAIVINDIPAGTQFGTTSTDVCPSHMIAFGLNFGAMAEADGKNVTDEFLTIWRNAAYILTNQTVPTTLYVNPHNHQTITFGALASKNVGDANFDLTATASSGLDVTYESSNTAVATVVGSTVTIVGAGSTDIKAIQGGGGATATTAYWYAAQDVIQTLTVSSSSTTPTFTADASANTVDNVIDITFADDATWRAAVTAVKIGATTLTSGTDYDLTSGNLQLKPAGLNSLLTTPGTKSVTVVATGYTDGMVSQDILVGVPTAVNSSATISAALAPNTSRTITATAKDQYNNPVSGYAFKYDTTITNNDGTTGESYTIDGTSRTATTNDIALVAVTNGSGVATFDAALPATIDGNDGVSIQVQLNDGTTNVGSAFSFAQLGSQTITFNAFGTVTYGDANFNLTATASSTLPVSYTSSNTAVATVSGNTVTIVGVGSTDITASQSGNGSYNAATPVIRTMSVDQKKLTLPDAVAASRMYNGLLTTDISGTLTGIVNSEDVTFDGTLKGTFADANVANGIAVTSTCTLSGTKSANYTLTQPTGLTANITKANQTITFGALASKNVGDADFALTATASSGIAVTYASSNGAVATVSGSTVSIAGAGSTDITASQAGNSNYNAATPVMQTLNVSSLVTTWTTAWSNGTPSATIEAVINGTYSTATNGVFSAKKLTVNAAKSLTVNTGTSITVQNEVINNGGSLVIENNANLIQVNNTTNTGNAVVKRNGNLLFRLDYTMWSSPTGTTQKLNEFSPLTATGRFYTYDPTPIALHPTGVFAAVADATPFGQGKGFLIRMPNTDPTSGYDAGSATLAYLGVFTGVPNNGDVNVAGTSGDYIAVGNPYPSTISADAFIDANSTGSGAGTLYFWRKTNNLNQGTTPTTSYATYTKAGPVGLPAGSGAVNGGFTPTADIAVGQGFITTVPGSGNVAFTNALRTSSTTSQFMRTKQEVKDRVWLNLSAGTTPVNQILVAYIDGATTGVDAGYDGEYINDAATALTSDINGGEYVIQGRPAFDASDIVPLNFKTEAAGSFTIVKDHSEGVFATGQDVYLVDATTGTETNLQTDGYTFTAAAGVDNTRFSLKYQKTLKVDASSFNENSVLVYENGGTIYVNSGSSVINNVKVFDLQGKLITELKDVNANTTAIKNLKANQQVLIVQVTSEDNQVVNKKVVN